MAKNCKQIWNGEEIMSEERDKFKLSKDEFIEIFKSSDLIEVLVEKDSLNGIYDLVVKYKVLSDEVHILYQDLRSGDKDEDSRKRFQLTERVLEECQYFYVGGYNSGDKKVIISILSGTKEYNKSSNNSSLWFSWEDFKRTYDNGINIWKQKSSKVDNLIVGGCTDSNITFLHNAIISRALDVDSKVDDNKSNYDIEKLSLQTIYSGAPGTGKSHTIKIHTEGESVVRTTFHPDSDYSTFVGCYKPTTKEVEMRDVTGKVIIEHGKPVTENRIIYQFVDQAFLQAYIKAWKFYAEAEEGVAPKKQFLIIEEINRGNCAQIFGDLFQLLDRNDYGFSEYFIHADKDMQKHLSNAFKDCLIKDSHKDTINSLYPKEDDVVAKALSGEILLLPNNLYIWATMNTSDQSLFPIDSAFKRRWDWKYRPIVKGRDKNGSELNWRIKADTKEYDWWSFLEKINVVVGTTTNSEDKKLGFFFCKPTDSVITAETFVGKVVFYLWNDVFKNFGFDDPIFKDEDGSTLEFDKFYTTDINGDTIVRTDKVERFLENLKVKVAGEIITEIEDEDGNTSSTSTRDYSKYSINGVGKYGKNSLAAECVKEYIKLNPEMSVEDVLTNWKSLGNIVTHFVESKEEHDARTDNSTRFDEIPCGDTFVYVEKNGYGNNGAVDKLIAAVNQKDWNIKIDKVE